MSGRLPTVYYGNDGSEEDKRLIDKASSNPASTCPMSDSM